MKYTVIHHNVMVEALLPLVELDVETDLVQSESMRL